jgi:hypothetical protein
MYFSRTQSSVLEHRHFLFTNDDVRIRVPETSDVSPRRDDRTRIVGCCHFLFQKVTLQCQLTQAQVQLRLPSNSENLHHKVAIWSQLH